MAIPRNLLCFLSLLIPAALPGWSQTGKAPIALRTLDETPVASLPDNITGYRTVPGEEEFYFQALAGNYLAVNLKGETRVALDLSKIPVSDSFQPNNLSLTDVAPDPRGGVIGIAVWEDADKNPRSGLLRFDEDGDFSGLVQLDADLFPAHVAEFSSSGGYLVAGYDNSGHVRLALFDTRGTMLIPDVLRSDAVDAASKSESGKIQKADRDAAAIKAGRLQLASGDDDAVYLFDPAAGRKAVRIRPNGRFSEIPLPKPVFLEDKNTLPLVLLISHSSLYLCEAILDKSQKSGNVMELKHFVISVYDRYSGTLEGFYQTDSTFGSAPVAARPREFYFLHAKSVPGLGLGFSIVRAAP